MEIVEEVDSARQDDDQGDQHHDKDDGDIQRGDANSHGISLCSGFIITRVFYARKNLNPVLGGCGFDSWWGTRSLVLDELGLEAGATLLQLLDLFVDLRNFVLDRRVVQDSAGGENAGADGAHGGLEGHGNPL